MSPAAVAVYNWDLSEVRFDPATGRKVIYAPARARRPSDYRTDLREIVETRACPFCPGNERETTKEVFALRDSGAPDEPGWRVRVVPNRYPALTPPQGFHEVIIESPVHGERWSTAPLRRIEEALEAWQERLRRLSREPGIRGAVIFKNHGWRAGATRVHPHSQLMALPFIPPQLDYELQAAPAAGPCPWCRGLENAAGRVVFENGGYAAVAPEASRQAYEVWLLPKEHASRFEEIRDLAGLAGALQRLWRCVESALHQPAVNAMLMTAPLDAAAPHYHWRLEILPRLGTIAGFEWATGCYINSVLPEQAAERLRRADPDSVPPGEAG